MQEKASWIAELEFLPAPVAIGEMNARELVIADKKTETK